MSDQDAPPPTAAAMSGDERERENQRSSDATQRSSGGGNRERERHPRRRHQPSQHQPPRRPTENMLPMDELRDLVELIGEHGFTDFEFERQDFRIRLRRDLAPQIIQGTPPAASTQTAPPASTHTHATETTPAASPSNAVVGTSSTTQSAAASSTSQNAQAARSATSEEESLHIITSPIVGTFYRASSPTAEPFARIGSHVAPETTVCIIEAMKLMNEIQAETSGEVVKIYVENAQPVEYGQPLFGIRK